MEASSLRAAWAPVAHREAELDGRDALDERFRAFVVSHRERAVRLAWRLVGGDAAAAEDVAQDAFVRAHQALARFREESSLATWFYRILVRQASSHRRWRAVRERFAGAVESDPPDPVTTEADPALRRRIARALDALTRKQREAVVLVHLDGFTVSEAAEILRTPTGTLKSHLHRALVKLREELSDLRPAPEGVEA